MGKRLFLTVLFLSTLVISTLYLAGLLFFFLSKSNPFGKVDLSTWITYLWYYHSNESVLDRLVTSGFFAFIICSTALIMIAVAISRNDRKLHGAARFASQSEVVKSGLLGTKGIVVGKLGSKFLLFDGMQFVLLAAPTRSGKGVGVVIPNALNWDDSSVIMDVKLENFLITSKFRQQHGQDVYLFNPFCVVENSQSPLNSKTHCYNPFSYISKDKRLQVTDIIAISYSLYPGEGKDSFFDDAARNLFLGMTLYLIETPTLPLTMGELLRQSSGKGKPIKNYIQGLIIERNYNEIQTVEDGKIFISYERKTEPNEGDLPLLSDICVDALNRFTSTSDNTLASIMATFNVPLTLWSSPIIDAATSTNDFDLRDIRKKRMSIYFGVPANKLAEAKVLINLFYTQLVNLNTDQLLNATPELKHPVLIIADEFTAPGRIGIIDSANSFMAGYGLRLLTIVQSPGQLEAHPPKGYGKENARTFITNHACQIFYTPREQQDAKEYSEALGYETVESKSRSRSASGTNLSESFGEGSGQRRALMLPQELKEMSQDEEIVTLENTKPIKCTKIAYYKERIFIDRLKSVSPSLAKISGLPNRAQLESIWGSGELASPVPLLDVDLHEAKLQDRTRTMTEADLVNPIDLNKIAIPNAVFDQLSNDMTPEDVNKFTEDFFNALGSESAIDEELYGEDDNQTEVTDVDMTSIETTDNSFPSEDFDFEGFDEPPSLDDFGGSNDVCLPEFEIDLDMLTNGEKHD